MLSVTRFKSSVIVLFFIEECVFPVTRNAAYEGMLWLAKAMKLQIVNHDYEQASSFYAVN